MMHAFFFTALDIHTSLTQTAFFPTGISSFHGCIKMVQAVSFTRTAAAFASSLLSGKEKGMSRPLICYLG